MKVKYRRKEAQQDKMLILSQQVFHDTILKAKMERKISHEPELEEAYWKGYNDGYAQSTKDWLKEK